MELLQTLGIDIKLLVFQIINFGILVFLLSKFLYRPLIKRIEDDEQKLQAADKAQAELEKEKDAFEKARNDEELALQEKSRQVVGESEDIAQRIITEAHEQAKIDADRIIKNADNLKELHSKEEIEKLRDTTTKELKASTRSWVQELMGDQAVAKKLEAHYWEKLNKLVADLPINSDADLGVFTLQTVGEASDINVRGIEKTLDEKLPGKVQVKPVSNPDLIAGFRLEGGGYRVDANIEHEIAQL